VRDVLCIEVGLSLFCHNFWKTEVMVASGYIIEQILICCVLGVVTLVYALWRIHKQQQPENAGAVRSLHRTFNQGLMVLAIAEIIWGVDPRGIWGIYPAELIAACKDFITSSLMCLGIVWMDAHLRILAESLGKMSVNMIPGVWTIGIPVFGTYVSAMILFILSAISQENKYRVYYIYFLEVMIFCECFAVTACLIRVMWVRKLAGLHVSHASEQGKKMRRLVTIGIALWVAFLFGIFASYSSSLQADISLTESQIPPNKTQYSVYVFLVLHFLGFAISFEAGRFQIMPRTPKTQPDRHSRQASRSAAGAEVQEASSGAANP
jgi:hypothetical protein